MTAALMHVAKCHCVQGLSFSVQKDVAKPPRLVCTVYYNSIAVYMRWFLSVR